MGLRIAQQSVQGGPTFYEVQTRIDGTDVGDPVLYPITFVNGQALVNWYFENFAVAGTPSWSVPFLNIPTLLFGVVITNKASNGIGYANWNNTTKLFTTNQTVGTVQKLTIQGALTI